MPRPPAAVDDVAAMPEAVFSPLAERARERGGAYFPLHVGDTWLEPFPGARLEALRATDGVTSHRYTPTRGDAALVDAIVEKVRAHNRLPAERESVLVTAGATAGLASAVAAFAAPGEEVLILAPFWPLIRGIVQAARARPIEVPFYDRVDGPEAAVEAVQARASARSVALYVSTPSNPTGRRIPGEWLAALAEWARREDLWILSDEVYEELGYRGEHVSIGRFAPERTLSVFSFSKAYALAGYRIGYVVGPPSGMAAVHKVSTHAVYSAPTPGQLAARNVLTDSAARRWIERARELYRRAGDAAAEALGVSPPEGGTFLFLDVRPCLDARGVPAFLEDCLEDGLLLAPGASSGAAYAGWVRLCFTACPPSDVGEATRRLARRLGRPRKEASGSETVAGGPE